MNQPHYIIQRPHLLLGIILVVLALILLALAAAQVWQRDRPIDHILQPVIATPADTDETREAP